jgi:hypothetical protein
MIDSELYSCSDERGIGGFELGGGLNEIGRVSFSRGRPYVIVTKAAPRFQYDTLFEHSGRQG